MRRLAVAGLLVATAGLVVAPNLSPVSLAGSSFEIDANANLVVDTVTAGDTDWASLAHGTSTDPEKRATDLATGTNDNSYKGGVKEDTVCPDETTGSIPNNKSDLLSFHVYEEPGVGSHPGFLNLAWSRVSEPSGATLMDFEFNQASLDDTDAQCSVGPNVERTAGDLLIEYGLASNGTSATITKRVWSGSAWGTASDLSAAPANSPCGANTACAEGRVNTTAIAEGDSDGIGARSARTFGEMQLDLRAIFGVGQCAGFGTATLKSRSSESFTSQLKDFIDPIKVDIDNCGSITINKVTENGNDSFAFAANGTGLSDFSLGGSGQQVFSNLAADSYTVTETLTAAQVTAGWTLKDITCTGTAAAVVETGGEAAITLANNEDAVCTYTNHIKLSPTISTLLNGASANLSVALGSSVYDTATLSGATANAGGTVTFTFFPTSACLPADGVSAGSNKPFVSGTATSDSVQFNNAGLFYWQAVYSGDANNNGATSACTAEVLTVQKASPTATTAQDLLPNDTFTLLGGVGATGNVSFSLFGPGDANCSGTAAYTQTVALTGGNTASTTNATFHAQTEGTWRWVVAYTGDANNNGVTLACGHERFTIDNDAS